MTTTVSRYFVTILETRALRMGRRPFFAHMTDSSSSLLDLYMGKLVHLGHVVLLGSNSTLSNWNGKNVACAYVYNRLIFLYLLSLFIIYIIYYRGRDKLLPGWRRRRRVKVKRRTTVLVHSGRHAHAYRDSLLPFHMNKVGSKTKLSYLCNNAN